MPGKAGKWDDAMERKFLMTIIHVASPTTPNWAKVAELMNEGFTGNALRQKFDKMKKEAREQFGEINGAASPVKKTKAAGGGKRKKARDEEPEVDDDEVEESPAKKVKAEATQDDEGDEV